MTNATLRGKPDAGNPHVRFDEGEVASAKPWRGSLLYKTSKSLHVLAVLGIAWSGAAADRSYTAAGTVAETISGTDSVTVNATCTYNQFVAFTGDNSYSGGTTLAKGNVSVDHVNALGTAGAIHCASGTTVRVTVSYRAAGTTLKAALLDRIVVDAPTGGGTPWVAIKLDGDGLKNDVDFTGQPNLWLCSSSPTAGTHSVLQGIFTPEGDVYRFGYSGNRPGTSNSGICVTNLTDNPVTGAARSVHCRGLGSTSFCFGDQGKGTKTAVITYSGSFTAEDSAFVADIRDGAVDFGRCTDATASNKLVFRNGAFWTHHAAGGTFPQACGVVVEGKVTWYHSGNGALERRIDFKGDFSGHGTLTLQDLGGAGFSGANNTFTGKIVVNGTYNGTQYLAIGDGTHFSWQDDVDVELQRDGRSLLLNTDRDVDFRLNLIGTRGSSVIKRGKGCVTIVNEITRTCANGAPVFRIEKGAIRRTVTETAAPMAGTIYIEDGAVFDLGGVPATSCYLPTGAGCLTNPAAPGTLDLVGTLGGTQTFWGKIYAAPTVTLGGDDVWQLEKTAEFSGPMTIASGTVTFAGGLQVTGGVSVAANAALRFGYTNRTDVLKADFMQSSAAVVGGPNVTSPYTRTELFNLFKTNEVVNRRLDTTAFNLSTNCGGCFHSYQFAKPADMTAKAYRMTLPLEQMLGGVDRYDNYAVRFSGYFHAETSGTYSFQGKADDLLGLYIDGKLVFAANASYEGGSCTLEAGYHDFMLIFIDQTCDEYFWFQMKAPGEKTWRNVPLALLSGTKGPMTIGPVTGAGTIALSAGGSWPAADFTGFTGTVRGDGNTETPLAGGLALGSATIDFCQPWDNGGSNWRAVGTDDNAYVTNIDGRIHYHLTPGKSSARYGVLNSTRKVSMTNEWTFSFDLILAAPYNWAIGDGVFFGIQTDGPDALPVTWGFARAGTDNGYGLQAYVMNDFTPLDWCHGNSRVSGTAVSDTPNTNRTFMAGTNIKNGKYPLHCTLTRNCSVGNGTNLVATISGNGGSWSTTNAAALPSKFANGAYLTVRACDGGYYCRKYITNVSFNDGMQPDVVTFDGTLGLTGGAVTLLGRDRTTDGARLAAALDVTGTSALTLARAQNKITLTGANWSFAASPDATVTFGAGVTLPAGPVTVSCGRPADGARRLLADFSALGLGEDEYPAFVPAPGLKARVYRRGPYLYANFSIGTVILFH